jgi:phosphate butyryltransferase
MPEACKDAQIRCMPPTSLAEIRSLAQRFAPQRLAIAGIESQSAREAARTAEALGLVRMVEPDERADEDGCSGVARLAAAGGCDVVLKGSVRSDHLLRAILDRRYGLRTGRLLSDVLLYEDTLSGVRRLVAVTDGGVNVQPDAAALHAIIENALAVLHALGFARPRVAILSATEAVSDAVPSTVLARAIAGMPFSKPCDVHGPLALDNALVPAAARDKNITGPVAGCADLLVVTSVEAGNILGKAVKYLGGSSCAHVVVGARVPVLIPSRVESAEDKLNSIALGVIAAEGVS